MVQDPILARSPLSHPRPPWPSLQKGNFLIWLMKTMLKNIYFLCTLLILLNVVILNHVFPSFWQECHSSPSFSLQSLQRQGPSPQAIFSHDSWYYAWKYTLKCCHKVQWNQRYFFLSRCTISQYQPQKVRLPSVSRDPEQSSDPTWPSDGGHNFLLAIWLNCSS